MLLMTGVPVSYYLRKRQKKIGQNGVNTHIQEPDGLLRIMGLGNTVSDMYTVCQRIYPWSMASSSMIMHTKILIASRKPSTLIFSSG